MAMRCPGCGAEAPNVYGKDVEHDSKCPNNPINQALTHFPSGTYVNKINTVDGKMLVMFTKSKLTVEEKAELEKLTKDELTRLFHAHNKAIQK